MSCFAENVLYEAVCFFPFMLFAYYPLRYFRRFSKKITCALELALAIPELILFLLGIRYSSEYIALFAFIIFAYNILAYVLLYKISIGRILFNLLLIVNLANFTVVFAKFLRTILFPNLLQINFHLQDSICILIAELVFILPMFFYMKHYSDSMIRNSTYDYIWRLAWIIPLILSILGCVLLYTPNIISSSEIALYGKKSIICALIAICLLLNYSIIAKLNNTQYGLLKLEKELYNQSLQQLQYRRIENQIKETRIIRHDLRHHIALMLNYVEQEEYDKLKDYLYQYCQSIEHISQLHYTNNAVLNTLLVYYADMCRSNQISFEANVTLPDTLPMQDNEIAVLFGNLLENAYQACLEIDRSLPCYVHIHACVKSNINLFVIENPFSNNINQDGIGNFLTTKSNGSGIGIQSAKEIISKYDGYIAFRTSDGIFSVSVSLPNKAT